MLAIRGELRKSEGKYPPTSMVNLAACLNPLSVVNGAEAATKRPA
jgi:hypothetical protein